MLTDAEKRQLAREIRMAGQDIHLWIHRPAIFTRHSLLRLTDRPDPTEAGRVFYRRKVRDAAQCDRYHVALNRFLMARMGGVAVSSSRDETAITLNELEADYAD